MELWIGLGNEEVGICCGELQSRGGEVCLNSHGVLLEKIVGDVMIGIAFEIGFVCLIGLEIDLLILQYSEWLFESSWNLLAGYIKWIGDDI